MKSIGYRGSTARCQFKWRREIRKRKRYDERCGRETEGREMGGSKEKPPATVREKRM